MKSYREEYRELWSWYLEQRSKLDPKMFEQDDIPPEHAKLVHEYHTKLDALRIKYGLPPHFPMNQQK